MKTVLRAALDVVAVRPSVSSAGGESGEEWVGGHPGCLGDHRDRDHVELSGKAEGRGGPLLHLPEPTNELLVEHRDRLAHHQRKCQQQILTDGRLPPGHGDEPGAGGPGAEPLQPEVPDRRPGNRPPEEPLRAGFPEQ